ncbi:serine hydrolase domain-containing protein [Amycolatopsis taiwanensis]|uniref:Serine hydrolase n=1 Tax=Amycolatopsis taiwanensis TaxID=342230 RepID=A0A9W6R711_9PSEU|nr:serine hydrolase domain-containing protein [Amycolatopsis taiwanensis]GLY68620.1 serine hydrolase [Amycolatopsis taiwanensis]
MVNRRAFLAAGTFAATFVVGVTSSTGASAIAGQQQSWVGRFDRPRQGFAPANTVLRDGPPGQVGLDPAPIRAAEQFLANWTRNDLSTGHPHFSGAVGLLAHDGVIVDRYSVGSAVRYADANGTELPADEQVPMRDDTIFDLASITKLFTSIAAMQLVEQGVLDLDAPVARYLPEFGTNGKQDVIVRQLLTHTSGLDADPVPPLWQGERDLPARRKAVLDSPLKNPPGTTYLYSDINLMTLGFLVERVTGATLDTVVRDRITTPLGMVDTGFNPPAGKLARIAATEDELTPPRGMLRGQVHDENAWALGGVSGHAGIFSTAGDLAIVAQAILNGGSYRGARILRPDTVREMLTNYNGAFPDDAHGLGFELDQMFYMGGLSSPVTAGHTGYTGTTLVIDPKSRSIAILLTNRVHPSRNWGSINLAREAWATALARALTVCPAQGRDAWFSDVGNLSTATLTTRTLHPRGSVHITFSAFVDTEATDPLVLESSTDGRSWQPVPVRATGPGAPAGEVSELAGHGHRAWWRVTAEIPATGQVILRWRYTTDSLYTGRGVYVDGMRVTSSNGILVDSERNPESLSATGWFPQTH